MNPHTQKCLKEFNNRFSKINHISRGECAITDVTGTRFEAHIEEGRVVEIGGLESVKDFLTSALAERDEIWSGKICEIVVQTDWANNSSEGVEKLSKLADLLAVEGDLLDKK